MDLGSKNRLSLHALQFFPNDTHEHRIARAVCRAGVLPRKEWFESWQAVKYVRKQKLSFTRVVDLCAGHGLAGWLLALLDKPSDGVLLVDETTPKNRVAIAAELQREWPDAKVSERSASLDEVELRSTDLVVSIHACGSLTDRVLQKAIAAKAHVAVLPCCHQLDDPYALATEGIIARDVAMDVARAHRLVAHGYHVRTYTLDPQITPKNRLIVGCAS